MTDWSGKTVVVTGSARGIGQAVASGFRSAGAEVFGLDRSPSSDCQRTWELDLADPDALRRAAADIGQAREACHALIHCAGICPVHPFAEAGWDSWRRTFEVNLFAAAELTRQLHPLLRAAQGSVVFVSSVSAWLPKLDQVEYGASKAAMLSLTKSLAAIFAADGIRVNAVAPGVIDTPLTSEIALARGIPPSASVPIGRLGTTSDVASVVTFIAGPEAAYMTGQVLAVDGGLTMR